MLLEKLSKHLTFNAQLVELFIRKYNCLHNTTSWCRKTSSWGVCYILALKTSCSLQICFCNRVYFLFRFFFKTFLNGQVIWFKFLRNQSICHNSLLRLCGIEITASLFSNFLLGCHLFFRVRLWSAVFKIYKMTIYLFWLQVSINFFI